MIQAKHYDKMNIVKRCLNVLYFVHCYLTLHRRNTGKNVDRCRVGYQISESRSRHSSYFAIDYPINSKTRVTALIRGTFLRNFHWVHVAFLKIDTYKMYVFREQSIAYNQKSNYLKMKQYLKLIRYVAQRTKSKNKMIEFIFFTKVQTMSHSGENF